MKRLYIITGAYGHLGSTIVRKLKKKGEWVRGLILKGEQPAEPRDMDIEVIEGDVRNKESLRPLFEGADDTEIIVIHTAAIIDITSDISPLTYDVNVIGTKNMVELALEYKVYRFIHVSSVHAIPAPEDLRIIEETKDFSPDTVEGGYAKTKAIASAYVMDAIKTKGLPGIILHPSGIIGPYDTGRNNLVRSIREFLNGKIRMSPNGGYDLVDVRDVADACIRAVDAGRVGETYILSNRHYRISEMFHMLHSLTGVKDIKHIVPKWLVKMVAPIMERVARLKKKAPLVTKYSIDTLDSNDKFSHKKASTELNFWPRDLYQTLKDTVSWLVKEKLVFYKKDTKKVKKSKKHRKSKINEFIVT